MIVTPALLVKTFPHDLQARNSLRDTMSEYSSDFK